MRRPFYHLTRDDREVILEAIIEGIPLSDIASTLGKSPTTISREVKAHRVDEGRKTTHFTNICIYSKECNRTSLCDPRCRKPCAHCFSRRCYDLCDSFIEDSCRRTSRWPYVCNGCTAKRGCGYARYLYHPSVADASANKIKSESRSGVSLSKTELVALDKLVSPLLKTNKQSPEVIWKANSDKIAVSAPTLRRYLDQGNLSAIRLDLLSAPSRKVRSKPRSKVSRHKDDGRSYRDFIALDEALRASCWELDTVHGSLKDRSCLLTLINRSTLLLFIFKIEACTAECVVGILDYLELLCQEAGTSFADIFSVILTDNGGEFSDAEAIESSCTESAKRCALYYCDPYCSSQKPYIEGRHTLIRRVLPKGQSFDRISHDKIALLASHINSYPASSRGGMTPIDLSASLVPGSLLEELGIVPINTNEVALTRDLL